LIELNALEVKVNQHSDKQISQINSDARLMKTHHMERQVCYNVETALNANTYYFNYISDILIQVLRIALELPQISIQNSFYTVCAINGHTRLLQGRFR
jgi:hypothetical protein